MIRHWFRQYAWGIFLGWVAGSYVGCFIMISCSAGSEFLFGIGYIFFLSVLSLPIGLFFQAPTSFIALPLCLAVAKYFHNERKVLQLSVTTIGLFMTIFVEYSFFPSKGNIGFYFAFGHFKNPLDTVALCISAAGALGGLTAARILCAVAGIGIAAPAASAMPIQQINGASSCTAPKPPSGPS